MTIPSLEIRYDDKKRIFYKTYSGKVTLDRIIDTWEDIINNGKIPADVEGFIIDYTEADLQMDPSEAKEIYKFYNKHLKVFRKKKIALIMTDPSQIVFPYLVQAERIEYYLRPFMTIDAAEAWMLF